VATLGYIPSVDSSRTWLAFSRVVRTTALVAAAAVCAACATGPSLRAGSRPQDFVVTYPEAGSVVRAIGEALAGFSAEATPADPREAMRRFLSRMGSLRDPSGRAADTAFRRALERVELEGRSFDMKPVQGDRFAVQALYLRDGTFFLVDTIDQTHLLCLCRPGDTELIAAGTQAPWRVAVRIHPDLAPMPVRVFAFVGLVGRDREAAATPEQLAGCFARFADKGLRARGPFGAAEQQHIQAVHDWFFQVDRRGRQPAAPPLPGPDPRSTAASPLAPRTGPG
jgi:hypothetical protein